MKIIVPKSLPAGDALSFTAIDFERANNSNRSVCQVGLCVVENGTIVRSYETLVRPPSRVGHFMRRPIEIHGITSADVVDAPTFDEVWELIKGDVKGRPLAAHSFRDDALTFEAVLRHYKIDYPFKRYGHLCTLDLALKAGFSGENNKFSLESLCERFDIPLTAHHAGSDAEGCARLALKMADELGIHSLRELADLSQTPDFRAPELPDHLRFEDLEKLEGYFSRLRAKKKLQLVDCPRQHDLSEAMRVLKRHPSVVLERDAAMSGRALSKWFSTLSPADIPKKRRRSGRRSHRPARRQAAEMTA